MPTLMPNGPGTDHTPPRKPLQPLNSGFLIYFLLPPLVNCYPLPYLRVLIIKSFIQFSSVAQLCPTLCNPMNCSTPGLPVHHQLCSAFFQLSHPYMTTGKIIALTRWTFVGKVMSLLFNILSRLVITFLPRSKCLLISWLQSPSAMLLETRKIKSATVSLFAMK